MLSFAPATGDLPRNPGVMTLCAISLDRETGITVTKGVVTMGKLEDKVAFITGAARGQGRRHAIRLAQEGADIIAVDITEQVATVPYATAGPGDMEQTVKEVEALDRRIIASEADVRDLAALRKAADDGVAALGRLDIVLANAGISTMSPTIEMEEEMWDTMIDINLTGVWKTVRAAVPHIVAGGRGGSVVLTSSLAAIIAYENIGLRRMFG